MDEPTKTKAPREAARIEEDALYSAKGHWEAARQWAATNLLIGIPTIIAGALAAGTALKAYALLAGVLSALSAVGSALLTFLKPSDRANLHTQAGNSFKSLQNRARVFRELDVERESDDKLVKVVKELGAERDNLNLKSPIIPRGAFKRARRGIEAGEAAYVVDKKSD